MRTNLHVKFICASGFPAGNANGHHKKHVFDSPSIRTIQVTWMDKCHFVTQNTGLDNREKNLLCIWAFSDRAAGVNPVLARRRPRCRVHSHKWTASSASAQKGAFSSENTFYSNIISTARGMSQTWRTWHHSSGSEKLLSKLCGASSLLFAKNDFKWWKNPSNTGISHQRTNCTPFEIL